MGRGGEIDEGREVEASHLLGPLDEREDSDFASCVEDDCVAVRS